MKTAEISERLWVLVAFLTVFSISFPSYSQQDDHHEHDHEHAEHERKHESHNHDLESTKRNDLQVKEKHNHVDDNENEHIDTNGHDHHGAVSIEKSDLGLFEVEIVKVNRGELIKTITIPGEVSLNKDRITHIVPRISGIVKQVHVNIGQQVKEGDLLATLESAELADAKAQYLSSMERMTVNKEIFELVEKLKKEGVSFTKEYLDAKQQFAEANIQLKNAKQKLLTYGLKEKGIVNISKENISDFMRYQVVSPVEGTILEKHISRGEFLKDDRDTMTIANLNDVWINLNVFQDDFPFLKVGTEVTVSPKHTKTKKEFKVAYMAPVVNETTRTALARVVASNTQGQWRPGEFIQGSVVTDRIKVDKLIPKSAVQHIDGKPKVFVEDTEHKGVFFPREVVLGKNDNENYEVLAGVELGTHIVAKGSFVLKAQASKAELDDGHNH